jgi:hypothetical protein
MNKIIRIQAGESLPFKFDRGGESLSGWTCTITAKQYPGDTATINRVIPLDDSGLAWSGYLTADETSPLAPGLWFLTASLVNLDNNEMEQIPVRFGVAPAWTP